MANQKPKQAAPDAAQDPAQSPLSPMQVDVQIKTITPNRDNVRAYASANINGCFKIDGIKVVEGQNGLFVSMPSFKSGNEYVDYCLPVTKEFREQLYNQILDAFKQAPVQTAQAREATAPMPTDVTVKITKIMPGNSKVNAFATANLNGSLGIRGIKIVDGTNGPAVSMPGYMSRGRYNEVCFPTDKAFRDQFSNSVLFAYGQEMGKLAAQADMAQQQNAGTQNPTPGQQDTGGQSEGPAQAM